MNNQDSEWAIYVSQKPPQTGKPAGNQVNRDNLGLVKCIVGSDPTDPGYCSGFASHLRLFSEQKHSIVGQNKDD